MKLSKLNPSLDIIIVCDASNKSINKPKLHLTGKRNWINDPNGLIYYKGKYH
ncbi:MAG: hypothetical protein E6968_05055, partial [Peptostreptococcaceae bacterium]|nr:hypothetical protein [Peptostreptococcaceae bacterium]